MIVCKYKFDSSIYSNLIPEFNSGYNGYSINDTTDGNIVTRTIECDTLPTLMRFGQVWVSGEVQQDYTRCLLEVLDMNASELTSCNSMFRYCINLTSINCNWNTSNVTDIRGMFHSCPNLTQLDVSNFDTSKVTDMSYMFYNCNKLAQLDVSNFNTSKVTNMNSMFYNCTKLTSLDVSNFDTSNVINMYAMFYYCNNLTQLDVSNFNTSNVTDMGSMFSNCTKLTQLNVSNFDTNKVTTMYSMFNNCKNLTQLDVSNFDTSNVNNMSYMFSNCNNLTQLDVSNWNTSNVTNMEGMFRGCQKLTLLNVSNWNTSKVTNMGYIIYHCRSLKTLSLSSWNFDSVTNAVEMFYDCSSLVTLDAPNMRIPVYGDNFFGGSCPVKYIRVNNLDVINTIEPQLKYDRTSDNPGYIVTNIAISSIPTDTISALASKNWTVVSDSTLTKVAEYVYDSKICRSMIPKFNDEFVKYFIDDVEDENGLVTRIISSIDELPTLMRFGQPWVIGEVQEDYTKCLLKVLDMNTSELASCNSMFRYCNNLTSINCNWNTSNVTSMSIMFNACTKLTQLDVSNFNTSKVTNMQSMFHNCNNLTQLDVSNFNTSKVTYMDAMFHNCKNLTQLDVSNFNTANVADMGYMFYNCNKLTSLDVNNFDTSNVANMEGMFSNCPNLTQLDVSNFDTSNVNNMGYMFYNCTNLTQLDVSNFDTSNVTNMKGIFNNTSKLVNIGMLYCSPSTINTISSNLSNTLQKNIWIQNVKPSELPSYDYISYKKYKEEKELNLNSPLLEGDKIVKKDGKMYHYHKMGKVVFDGSEDWWDRSSYYFSDTQTRFSISFNAKPCASDDITLICDKYPVLKAIASVAMEVGLGINLHIKGSTIYITVPKTTLEEFKSTLQANPTTVVYELANPYYEEISNDTLYLSIDKLSDYKMVVNNSTIPTKNMVQNRTFSTITLKPNTVYTVKFDRIGTDELTIDLGGTITTCVGNKVEIITSNEITRDDIVFYGDDEISNVMVIESSFDENNIPKENFEGLKSSFEDGYIPENLMTMDNFLYKKGINNIGLNLPLTIVDKENRCIFFTNVLPNTVYTILLGNNLSGDSSIVEINSSNITTGKVAAWIPGNRTITTSSDTTKLYIHLRNLNNADFTDISQVDDKQLIFLEGDWTHLTEEDFNNLGKYKVEYKTINCPIEFGKGGRIK